MVIENKRQNVIRLESLDQPIGVQYDMQFMKMCCVFCF